MSPQNSAPGSVHLFGLSGSLRKDSFSTAILRTLAEAIAPQAQLEVGNVGTVPLYNQDEEGDNAPASVVAMRKSVMESHGLVLVSPEYNHGMAGGMKNAIDWLSRPPGKSALPGKSVLIITSSPAFTGGVRAQAQIRESLISAGARPLLVPEIVIAQVHTKITEGRLTDKPALDFAMKALTQLINEVQPLAAKAA